MSSVRMAIARLAMLLTIQPILAQQAPVVPAQQPEQASPSPTPGEDARLNYSLGPNDQILIRVPVAEEINEKTFKVDAEGNLSLPLVGVVPVGGMTVGQVEADLTKRLTAYYRLPVVTVTVMQYRSDPVFFVGAFQKPGIYPLQGKKTLVEMLSTIGGLQQSASRRLTVTRRAEYGKLPLPDAAEDPKRNLSTAQISLTRLMETVNSEEDIVLRPFDVIRVGLEEMVYLQGVKAGSFPLGEKQALSVLQVISMAGGLPPDAKLKMAVVLRPVLDTARRAEIPVDVKDILAGRANDFPLMPNDVLVVPPGGAGVGAKLSRFLWVAVPAVTTSLIVAVIYRRR